MSMVIHLVFKRTATVYPNNINDNLQEVAGSGLQGVGPCCALGGYVGPMWDLCWAYVEPF
jgi:hypothetical protein